jgi:hypothetical protein
MQMSNKSILFPWILCFITISFMIALSGCSSSTSTSNNPSLSTNEMSTESTSLIPVISPSLVSQVQSTSPIQLNPEGPWLIYPTKEGIKAANADGSGSILLAPTSITDLVASEPDIPSGISPNSKMIAHRKNSADGKGWELEIIHLPGLNKETITPLISASNLASMENDPGQAMLLTSAVVFESPVQWSPDGRFLAFVAALDGPSSDLYVYDTNNQKINHVTSGELEIALPIWSSDGSEIIYQVVTTFGTGAGWSANGVRAVHSDGSGDRLIYRNPNGTGPETFLGISRSGIALVDHFDLGGGGLYLVNLNTSEMILLTANYSSAAMDPVNGDYVFIDGQGKMNFSPNPGTSYQPVSDLLFTNGRVYWDMHYVYFIIQAEAVVGIDPFGNFADFRGVPYLAYDNNSRCIVTYGIECDTSAGIFTIPDAYGAIVYWVPDTRSFFYTLNYNLYYVSIMDQTSIQIDSGLLPPNPPDYRMIVFNAAWMK